MRNKVKYLLICFLFISCNEKKKPLNIKDYHVPMKYCIQNCIKVEFSNFHNKGSSWGTGSSSMVGLSQTQIYDRIELQCNNFFKGSNCCEYRLKNNGYYVNNVLESRELYGYTYGICKER